MRRADPRPPCQAPPRLQELAASSWALSGSLDVLKHVLELAQSPSAAVSAAQVPLGLSVRTIAAMESTQDAIAQLLTLVDPGRARDARIAAELMRKHGRALHDTPTPSSPNQTTAWAFSPSWRPDACQEGSTTDAET